MLNLYNKLIQIYSEYGFYKEKLISVVKKGKSGSEEIQKMMDGFRNNPPHSINNSDVMLIHDFQKQKTFDQIARYNLKLKAQYLMVTNGLNHYFCQMDFENEKYLFLRELPEFR